MAKHCVFPMFCGSGRSKSRFPKAADAEPSGKKRNEKLHAVVARSKFRSQKAQNTSRPELFCLRCSKSAHRCGANHVCRPNGKNATCLEHFWKLRRCGARSTCQSENVQNSPFSEHFWQRVFANLCVTTQDTDHVLLLSIGCLSFTRKTRVSHACPCSRQIKKAIFSVEWAKLQTAANDFDQT